MNELLLSEISNAQEDLIQTFSLLEKSIFGESQEPNSALLPIIESCEQACKDIDEELDKAELFINSLFVDQLFIDEQTNQWPLASFKLASGIKQRKLFPTLKAAVIAHIARECNFEADCVFVPNKVMVRIICEEQYAIIFDPITGESINYQELDRRMEEMANEPEDYHLAPVDVNTLIVEYLNACKQSLIEAGLFEQALRCVDLLIAFKPDSPEQRVERGFLLHQLDCFKVAYDDYRYFVEQCPDDPAAQLLKLQLENIKINETILH